MNRALPEMLHCLTGAAAELTVMDRQRARMNQVQQLPGVFNEFDFSGLIGMGELVNPMVKPDPGLETGWVNYGFGNVGFELGRTISSQPVLPKVADEKLTSSVGKDSFKKRKADKNQNLKVIEEEDPKEKRSRGSTPEEENKEKLNGGKNITVNVKVNKKETSGDASKENSKVTEVQNAKPDYIHVRARRGQATDSHSLAERVRREKISERMKYLQDLVPGCNKITGKAGMLDEIINYVQSLQRQVEFLSMKLAAVNPRLDFNVDNFFNKEIVPGGAANFPVSTEMINPAFYEINQLQQLMSCGIEMGINTADLTLRRTTSAAVTIPETYMVDSMCFNQIQPMPNFDAEFQNLYGVEFQNARSSYLSQQFSGPMEGDNSKMGM